MVRGTEGTAEGSTGLTIGHKRVGEEQRCFSRKTVGYLTSLTHEAVLHLHGVVDRTTIADNGVLADHTRTNEYRSIHRTHHGTLRESCSTTDLTVTLDDGVGNIFGIDNLHVITDIAAIRTRYAELILNHLLQTLLQLLITLMLHHQTGHLRIQLTEDGHITITHLVEHGDHTTLTISGIISGLEGTDVRDVTVVTDGIVVDVVTHLLNQAVVAHGDIPQGGIVNA